MAKTKTVTRYIPKMSAATKAKVGALARKGGTKALAWARDEKHTLFAIGAAVLLGLLKRNGIAIPHIDVIGTAGTYGLLAWGIGRWTKSTMASHAATGLLSIAAYEVSSGQGVSGDDGDAPQHRPRTGHDDRGRRGGGGGGRSRFDEMVGLSGD